MTTLLCILSVCLTGLLGRSLAIPQKDRELTVLTVATDPTDGYLRLVRSAQHFGYNLETVGLGKQWNGGDVATSAGGGHKLNLLSEHLASSHCKKSADQQKSSLLMFVDAYDVVLTESPDRLMETFDKLEARLVFSAEPFCWPNPNLAANYPPVTTDGAKPFLNSGLYMGYTDAICALYDLTEETLSAETRPNLLADEDDDQLFFTTIFLNARRRASLDMKLDSSAELFQNLNGMTTEIEIKFDETADPPHSYIVNTKTNTRPCVLHGNGPVKHYFNRFTDYLVDSWTPAGGCRFCREALIPLPDAVADGTTDQSVRADAPHPRVCVGFFIEQATPFIHHSLEALRTIGYPADRLSGLYIHNQLEVYDKLIDKFVADDQPTGNFATRFAGRANALRVDNSTKHMDEAAARDAFLDFCGKLDSDFVFMIDSLVVLDGGSHVVSSLVELNQTFVAPLLKRPGEFWSNFWGDLSDIGFYQRSFDYMEIVDNTRAGLWNIPFVNGAFLIRKDRFPALKGFWKSSEGEHLETDMTFCKHMREAGFFMYLSNWAGAKNTELAEAGHLLNADNFDLNSERLLGRLHPDMWMIEDNPLDWEQDFLHPDYRKTFDNDSTELKEPCPDVYWFPLVTTKYCQYLIEEMEHHDSWSAGKNEDSRLEGGYENVPTVDTHMNQVHMENEWLFLIKKYIAPVAAHVFTGYYSDSRASMNFVVRYRPSEQSFLRPHHDSSTFTINLALNQRGVDYEGGGCRFTRYNCSLLDNSPGRALMHPGRLTHQHEGLVTTKGTRYIMVSFVDP